MLTLQGEPLADAPSRPKATPRILPQWGSGLNHPPKIVQLFAKFLGFGPKFRLHYYIGTTAPLGFKFGNCNLVHFVTHKKFQNLIIIIIYTFV